MADQVPLTFGSVQSRFVEPSKQFFNNYSQPISRFFSKQEGYQDPQNGAAAALNGSSATNPFVNNHDQNNHTDDRKPEIYELDGATLDRAAALEVNSNAILKASENLACCKCRKRWQLAILANIGFMIVFGIRCNFGAAKNHMFRDYTDPWGVKHNREFNWTRGEVGVMESSFFYGYLITQIPAGFLAAKFAANK
ncbi:EAT-4 protein [Aphelenchoides avenae]|nr:EAT-4 protein [Aphelenchus avenae]